MLSIRYAASSEEASNSIFCDSCDILFRLVKSNTFSIGLSKNDDPWAVCSVAAVIKEESLGDVKECFTKLGPIVFIPTCDCCGDWKTNLSWLSGEFPEVAKGSASSTLEQALCSSRSSSWSSSANHMQHWSGFE